MRISDPSLVGLRMEQEAWAKVNLTLHVTGQRQDGYHLLDSLVVRAQVGDTLKVTAHDALLLSVDGPEAEGVPTDTGNLVTRAAMLLDRGAGRGVHIALTKRLPHAAGIGGGSADAATALHLLGAHWGLTTDADISRSLGADVPVCLSDSPQRMRGIGEVLDPITSLPPAWMVLANPRVDVPTGPVFNALESKNNQPMPGLIPSFGSVQEMAVWLGTQRNDLESPARRLVPEVSDCLHALSDALLARMSGSGATCFGLYETEKHAVQAAKRIQRLNSNWWVKSCQMLT